MSPAPAWELSYPPTTQQSHKHEDEDSKSPYDDLIDQYAVPFGQNPKHKSFKVDTSAFNAADRPHKSSEDTGMDMEGASSQGHDWAYPPTTPTEEKGKSKALTWSSVRVVRYDVSPAASETPWIDHTRLYCLSTIHLDGID